MLADAAIDQSVLIGLMSLSGVIVTAMVGGTVAMWRTAKSVGAKNGHGSLQESVTKVHDRLDSYESRLEADERKRMEGVRRQEQMQEAIEQVQAAITGLKQGMEQNRNTLQDHTLLDAAAFTRHDEAFDRLSAATERLENLLGAPRPGDKHEPVIPYLHDWVHDVNNQLAALKEMPNASATILRRALDTLERVEARLGEQ